MQSVFTEYNSFNFRITGWREEEEIELEIFSQCSTRLQCQRKMKSVCIINDIIQRAQS